MPDSILPGAGARIFLRVVYTRSDQDLTSTGQGDISNGSEPAGDGNQ